MYEITNNNKDELMTRTSSSVVKIFKGASFIIFTNLILTNSIASTYLYRFSGM